MHRATDEHPDGWVEIDFAAAANAATLGAERPAQQGIGPIDWRRTKIVPDGYWANTCQHCKATIGSFPLREALMDALSEGIARDQLPWFCRGSPPTFHWTGCVLAVDLSGPCCLS